MQVQIELTGATPLLMHNVRLSDPDDEYASAIAKVSAKRKKTEEDRHEIARLEWFGGLYTQDGMGIVMPTRSIRKCLIETAKVSKQGKQVSRALAFEDQNVPLTYEGPTNLDELYDTPGARSRLSVKVGTSRVMRTRPQFDKWSLVANAFLLTEVMDLDDLERIVVLAGSVEGIGDNRSNGYGRFAGAVKS